MPFTFAHPAIVLPLPKIFKRYVSATGLIAGSIAPDFEYFFRLEPASYFSHTLSGTLYFNLPLALFLAFLFHLLIRNPLIEHLPKELFYRFHPYRKINWLEYVKKHYLVVMVSIIIGALSHIFWDSFTHPAGTFVRLFPVLKHKIWYFPLYRVVQHGSTIVGFAFIGWYIFRKKKMYARRPTNRTRIKSYWLAVVAVAFCLMGIQLISGYFSFNLGVLVVAVVNGCMLGLFLSSLFFKRINAA